MAKRYELPDAAWDLVADIFTKISAPGALGPMIA